MWGQSKNREESEKLKLFEEQIHPLYNRLYRTIFAIVRNHASAEDVLQNTLEKAYVSLPDLRDKTKLNAWISTIAKNEAISYLRKYRKETLADSMETMTAFFPVNSIYMLPDELLIRNEVYDKVVSIINNLSPKYRDVVILRYYADLTLEEIAASLNISVNTVKTRHRRLKGKIYKELLQSGLIDDSGCREGGGVVCEQGQSG